MINFKCLCIIHNKRVCLWKTEPFPESFRAKEDYAHTGTSSFPSLEGMDFQEMRTNVPRITWLITALLLHVDCIRLQVLPRSGVSWPHPFSLHMLRLSSLNSLRTELIRKLLSTTSTTPAGEGLGEVVGGAWGRGLCSRPSLTSPRHWLTAGRLLPVPVGGRTIRHRPIPSQRQFFLPPPARRGKSRLGRLGTEGATVAGLRAWSLSLRGARREWASGSKVRKALRFSPHPAWSSHGAFLIGLERTQIDTPHKSSWKWKVKVEWGSGPCCWREEPKQSLLK